ncbi:hypothetical protein JCM19240_2012 [Vibrio maritimus]|uniref:Uncharacterized protein n=1 Tax=Vibrio maritimus TaxID=990268 RepID=A0A090T039_9VIBR|nr:hypothetical protein JCM19240_2012 [Vibrio maritimus]
MAMSTPAGAVATAVVAAAVSSDEDVAGSDAQPNMSALITAIDRADFIDVMGCPFYFWLGHH